MLLLLSLAKLVEVALNFISLLRGKLQQSAVTS
jgi:hypothetical protein